MKTRLALTDFIDEIIYQVVLRNRHLSDAAEMPDMQYKALRYIHKHGKASMRDISTFTGVSLPMSTKIIDGLEKAGYITRGHEDDRRKVIVRLSAKGSSAIEEARKMHEDLSEAILAPLVPAERAQMYSLLKKCYDELKVR